MVALVDSNIVLDQMLKRDGFYEVAEDIMTLSSRRVFDGYISASAITDIYYIARKAHQDKGIALSLIRKLICNIHVATVDEGAIRSAVNLEWNDFEDSVQYSIGESINADYIVTRDTKGYANGNIPAISPTDFVNLITTN